MGHSKGTPEREVHNNTGLPKKDRNNTNKQPNPTSIKNLNNNHKENPEHVEVRK